MEKNKPWKKRLMRTQSAKTNWIIQKNKNNNKKFQIREFKKVKNAKVRNPNRWDGGEKLPQIAEVWKSGEGSRRSNCWCWRPQFHWPESVAEANRLRQRFRWWRDLIPLVCTCHKKHFENEGGAGILVWKASATEKKREEVWIYLTWAWNFARHFFK